MLLENSEEYHIKCEGKDTTLLDTTEATEETPTELYCPLHVGVESLDHAL